VGLHRYQVALEPLTRQPGDFVQCSGLFEEVRCPGDDYELFFAAKLRESRPIQLDNLKIVAANDEQGGRSDSRQGRSRQIGAPSARNDRAHLIRALGRSYESGAGTGAGAKVTDSQASCIWLLSKPIGDRDEAVGKQTDVEAKVPRHYVDRFFLGGEQVDQQRR
jgi:hypothetical protein